MVFLVFYGQQLAGPSGAIHAAMISVSYATHRFIIAVANKNKRPQN